MRLRACDLYVSVDFQWCINIFISMLYPNHGLIEDFPWAVVGDPWGVVIEARLVLTEALHCCCSCGRVSERVFGVFYSKFDLLSVVG